MISKYALESGNAILTGSAIVKYNVILGKIFSVFYGTLRLVIGPPGGLWIVYNLFGEKGREHIGLTTAFFWSFLIVGVLGGSLPFAFKVALGW